MTPFCAEEDVGEEGGCDEEDDARAVGPRASPSPAAEVEGIGRDAPRGGARRRVRAWGGRPRPGPRDEGDAVARGWWSDANAATTRGGRSLWIFVRE